MSLGDLIDRALAEDVGEGDVTTAAVVPEGARARARIDQKADGVVAGLGVAEAVFERLDPELRFERLVAEGEWREGGPVAEIEGAAAPILTGERVALNFLGRLSGVATLTARFVRAVDGTGATVLDTRKTTPGLRALEKEAVRVGGGTNHRTGLYDAVLIKENHSTLGGGVAEATRRALERAPADVAGGGEGASRAEGEEALGGGGGEVGCGSRAEVEEALGAGAQRLLLDNMSPEELREMVGLVDGRA